MSAGQAAGTHCAVSESCVGITPQRGSCDLGTLEIWLGHKVAVNFAFGADDEPLGSHASGLANMSAQAPRGVLPIFS
jgi:hypothetical protein